MNQLDLTLEETAAEARDQALFSGEHLPGIRIGSDGHGPLKSEQKREFQHVDVEITGEDSESGESNSLEQGCRPRRKRTVRLVIRSQAFI